MLKFTITIITLFSLQPLISNAVEPPTQGSIEQEKTIPKNKFQDNQTSYLSPKIDIKQRKLILVNNVKNEEIIKLREQNKLIKAHQSSLLSTVYWSLGTTFGIFMALIGLNIWSNTRIRDTDIAILKEHVALSTTDLETKMEALLESSRTEFLKLVDSKVKNETDGLNSSVKELEKESNKIKEELGAEIKRLDTTVFESEFNLRLVEETVWETKGVTNNVIITQTQGIRAAKRAENKEHILLVAERLKGTLKTDVSEKQKTLDKVLLDFINEALVIIDEYDPILSTEIRSLIDQIEVKNDTQN